MISILSPEDALIAVMMVVSAADSDMSNEELQHIGAVVEFAPAFEGYDRDRIGTVAGAVADLLQKDEGLETLMGLVRDALPETMRETAYAFACDVAAADGSIAVEEMRLLEIIRYRLDIDRLAAAAIERSSRARHQKAPKDV